MKKLLIFMATLLLSISLLSMSIDTAKVKSNYQKYWEQKENLVLDKPIKSDVEYDDVYYQANKDKKTKEKKIKTKSQQIITINYYEEDPFFYSRMINRFYYHGFSPWYYNNPFFYNDFNFGYYPFINYYNYYNPWMFDNFYFGFSFNYYWPLYRPMYVHNNWNHYYVSNPVVQKTPQYSRRERPNNFSTTQPTIPSRRTNSSITPRTNASYNDSRRSYTPSYEKPKMTVRPQYNNSRVKTPRVNRAESSISIERINSNSNNTPRISIPQNSYSSPARSYSSTPDRNFGSSSNNSVGTNRSSFSTGSSSSNNRSYSSGSSSGNSSNNSSSGGSTSRSSGSSGSSTGRR